jgi:hypothetical protein
MADEASTVVVGTEIAMDSAVVVGFVANANGMAATDSVGTEASAIVAASKAECSVAVTGFMVAEDSKVAAPHVASTAAVEAAFTVAAVEVSTVAVAADSMAAVEADPMAAVEADPTAAVEADPTAAVEVDPTAAVVIDSRGRIQYFHLNGWQPRLPAVFFPHLPSPGNAILLNGDFQTANREIGVPRY